MGKKVRTVLVVSISPRTRSFVSSALLIPLGMRNFNLNFELPLSLSNLRSLDRRMILRFQRCLKVLISFLAAGDKLVSNPAISFSFPETVLSLIETSASPDSTCKFPPESSVALDRSVCVLKRPRAPRGRDRDFRAHIACLLRRLKSN